MKVCTKVRMKVCIKICMKVYTEVLKNYNIDIEVCVDVHLVV